MRRFWRKEKFEQPDPSHVSIQQKTRYSHTSHSAGTAQPANRFPGSTDRRRAGGPDRRYLVEWGFYQRRRDGS
jgi:hypothetical protein